MLNKNISAVMLGSMMACSSPHPDSHSNKQTHSSRFLINSECGKVLSRNFASSPAYQLKYYKAFEDPLADLQDVLQHVPEKVQQFDDLSCLFDNFVVYFGEKYKLESINAVRLEELKLSLSRDLGALQGKTTDFQVFVKEMAMAVRRLCMQLVIAKEADFVKNIPLGGLATRVPNFVKILKETPDVVLFERKFSDFRNVIFKIRLDRQAGVLSLTTEDPSIILYEEKLPINSFYNGEAFFLQALSK